MQSAPKFTNEKWEIPIILENTKSCEDFNKISAAPSPNSKPSSPSSSHLSFLIEAEHRGSDDSRGILVEIVKLHGSHRSSDPRRNRLTGIADKIGHREEFGGHLLVRWRAWGGEKVRADQILLRFCCRKEAKMKDHDRWSDQWQRSCWMYAECKKLNCASHGVKINTELRLSLSKVDQRCHS